MTKKQRYFSTFLFLLALAVAGVFHGVGMFQYPYFESDEGTYISQAWAIVNQGSLSPYTYWYDHPPGGWIFIAAWSILFTDGFFAFGSSIETGRVFMLVIHILSAAFIYRIVVYLTNRSLPAFTACFLFSVSPLAIYFQRRVLIDSLMVFWFLAAVGVLCIAYNRLRLRHYVISALFFAFACLTKLTAIFFAPAILYYLWAHHSPLSRYFRMTIWMMISGMIVSSFFLFAALSNELFQPTEGESHVSFFGAVEFQASRKGGSFLDPNSAFASALSDWADKDLLFVFLSFVIVAIAVFMVPFFKNVRFLVLATLPYVFFLISGGVNFNFYILPLIPVVVMAWSVYMHDILLKFPARIYASVFSLFLIFSGYYYFAFADKDHFLVNETKNQKESTRWIKENLPNDSVILIDNFAYVDFHDPRYINQKTFPNADWYYKVSRDVDVGQAKYDMNWRNFDYLSLSHEMIKQIQEGRDPIIRNAFDYSYPDKRWTTETTAFLDLPKMISTNGDWSMLYKISDSHQENLLNAWERYRNKSIYSYGQIVDLSRKETTSSGQANALMQAVMMNDEEFFNGIWLWTSNHLQWRVQDRLFASLWTQGKISNGDNDTAADADIAMALLFAAHMWDEPQYKEKALEIINSLWISSVVEIDDRYYALPYNKISARRYKEKFILNPASFSPAWYRIFADVDPEHDWNKLADDTYVTLNELSDLSWNVSGLPLNSFVIDNKTGEMASARLYFDDALYADQFGEMGTRVLWRTALDVKWFGSADAIDYVSRLSEFTQSYVLEDGNYPSAISATGRVISERKSILSEVGYLNVFTVTQEPSFVSEYYEKTLAAAYSPEVVKAHASLSATDENWTWLGYALYHGVFENILKREF